MTSASSTRTSRAEGIDTVKAGRPIEQLELDVPEQNAALELIPMYIRKATIMTGEIGGRGIRWHTTSNQCPVCRRQESAGKQLRKADNRPTPGFPCLMIHEDRMRFLLIENWLEHSSAEIYMPCHGADTSLQGHYEPNHRQLNHATIREATQGDQSVGTLISCSLSSIKRHDLGA